MTASQEINQFTSYNMQMTPWLESSYEIGILLHSPTKTVMAKLDQGGSMCPVISNNTPQNHPEDFTSW